MMTGMTELIVLAQQIFDRTAPTRKADGTPIRIPFERWTEQTQAHFLALAKLSLSRP